MTTTLDSSVTLSEEEQEVEAKSFADDLFKRNFGFAEISHQPLGICYINLEVFLNPNATFQGEKFILKNTKKIMEDLAKSKPKAVIFDLRNNTGGSPEMVQLLCSYFLPKEVPLNTLEWRGAPTEVFDSLSYEDLPVESRMISTPLYILISKRTFSAAEEFSNNLKVLGRATLIGETTGGGANPGDEFYLGEDLSIFIPKGKAVNPYTKTNWEGSGVTPNHLIGPTEDAFKRAKLMIQESSIQATDIRTQEI